MALARKLTSKIYEIKAHTQKVTCLDLGETGRVLVTGGQDRNVNLWAFGNDKCFMSLTGHNGQVDCVKFAYNDDYVYSSDENGIIKRWDLNAQPECTTFYGHMKSVRTLDFHPYGEYVVSGSNDTTVRLWDVRNNNNCIKKYRGHIANVNSVKFSPDGSWIASAGTEGSVIIWDIRMSKQIIEFLELASPVTCIQFHPFEFLLAAGRNDGTVDLYDLESKQLISRSSNKSPFNGQTVKCVTFSENGECLFVGTAAGISVIGWEPDRNYDHIDSSWSMLGDMKVVNKKLFCGSFENKSVDIHAIHLDQVIPFYNPSNMQFSQNQSSRKSFSRGNQKLRLSIGNNNNSSSPSQIGITNSKDMLNNEINLIQNSDGGMSSPNLSIEIIDENEEHQQTSEQHLTNGFSFNNKYSLSKTQEQQQNNSYDSLPSIDNYKYNNYMSLDGPNSLKLIANEATTADICIDNYTSDLDYYPIKSSPILNNVVEPEREDFPVNNAQPPDYAPKMDISHSSTASSINKSIMSKYKINSQLQRKQSPPININHINHSINNNSNNNNSNNNNNNNTNNNNYNNNINNNFKLFGQQTKKFSNLSTSISTMDLHKMDDSVNTTKKHLISSRTSSPVRNYIVSNKLKKNDTTSITTTTTTTTNINKENNSRHNRKVNVQILLPPNKPPPPPLRSKTSFDLRASSAPQPLQSQHSQLQPQLIVAPTSPYSQRSSMTNYTNTSHQHNSADESTEMRVLTSYHERVYQELSNRHATLQLIRNSTKAHDIVGALKQAIKMNDRSVLVDLLGAILEKTASWNLDMCLFLLPEIYDLIQSEHKFHCTRACDTLRVILSNFLPIIRENIEPWGAPMSYGVDISREERYKKCMDCRQWLLRIKVLPENKHMGSNVIQLQNLIVDL